MVADFNKIIQEGRERKANEKLATRIFSKNRRQSAPSALRASAATPSLASRITKKGQRQSLGRVAPVASPGPRSRGNINGEWTHDLHGSVSAPRNGNNNNNNNNHNAGSGSNKNSGNANTLAARITNPSAPASRVQANRKLAAKRTRAVELLASHNPSSPVASQVNIRTAAPPSSLGNLTIRGLAGPYCVMAQNFARGTTAADVESAMTPIGGPMESCRLLKTQPFVLVEMMFSSKDGADRVVNTFDGQTADGMVLRVWASADGPSRAGSASSASAPAGPRATRGSAREQVVDGRMGFDGPAADGRGLYSDDLVRGRRGDHERGGRYK